MLASPRQSPDGWACASRPGNIVRAATRTALVITQLQPMTAIFTIRRTTCGVMLRLRSGEKLPVELRPRAEEEARLGHARERRQPDRSATGTIKLKAQFPTRREPLSQ